MPKSTKDGWVDWRGHPAREIALIDFSRGGFLHGKTSDEVDIPQLLATCKSVHPDCFSEIVLDQFEARIKDYFKSHSKQHERSRQEEEWMNHDRQLCPRQPTNARGELVFDLHPAKALLREDIKNNRHIGIEPQQLQLTRTEHQAFNSNIFGQRIHQEIRFQKCCDHLENQRHKKRRKHLEKKAEEERKKREKKRKADGKRDAGQKRRKT